MQITYAPTLADAIFPQVRGNNRALSLARDAMLIIGGASLIALFAQIQVRLPAAWTPVPITGQTLAVLIAGGSLGAWRGGSAAILYMLVGMFLLPIYTPPAGVTAHAWDVHFILPWKGNEAYIWDLASGGYVVGFILSATVVGFLSERRWDRGPWVQVSMLIGTLLVYIPGVWWLSHKFHMSLSVALDKGLYPFIVGDLMKLIIAAMVLPGAWAIVGKLKPQKRSSFR